jgi:hypothetical protein
VQTYSECHLTKDEDKLTALAGVANSVQEFLQLPQEDYLAGLWRPYLKMDLLWHINAGGSRFDAYHAPSWSWDSVEGSVYFNTPLDPTANTGDFAIDILEARVQTSQENAFGPVKGGYITLTGPLCPVKLYGCSNEKPGLPFFTRLMVQQREFVPNESFSESLDHEQIYTNAPPDGFLEAYFCRFITRAQDYLDPKHVSEGVMLERATGEAGEFRRIDWMRVFHDDTEVQFDINSEGVGLKSDEYLDCDGPRRYLFKSHLERFSRGW